MKSIGKYKIKSTKSNTYITITQNNECILHDNHPKWQQSFELKVKDNSFVQFKNLISNRLITLSQGSDQNGAPFLCQDQNINSQQSQCFEIHYIDRQCQQVIIFTYCGKCLDCCQQSTKNGTKIIQWDFHGSGNQKWILQKI